VAVVFMVLLLGPALSTLSVTGYLQEPQTWRFLRAQALVLYRYTEVFLPGVFLGNPVGQVVNGSLWTLESEVRAYVALAAAWGFSRLSARIWSAAPGFRTSVTAATLGLLVWHAWALTQGDIEASPPRLYAMFALGCCACLWRERIPWPSGLWPVALATLVLAGLLGKPVFTLVYTAALPLAVLGFAYAAPQILLGYNRLGDYSYGLYIYAYPVQQGVEALWPGCSVLALGCASWAVTLVLAIASWHAVESPALLWLARRSASTAPRAAAPRAGPGA
jgi:peptidoglycan/LPS O-acetylase OafA/YrhL